VAGVKQALLMIAMVVLVGCGQEEAKTCYWCKEEIKAAALVCKHCGSKDPHHRPLIADPIVERAIRGKFGLNKPTGELTEADLAKVTELDSLSTYPSRMRSRLE